jgi:hypothetical protein
VLSRSQWKKLRQVTKGLPAGKRAECKCGGLLIFEETAGEVVLHHSEPSCADFQRVTELASFLTLAAVEQVDFSEALKKVRDELEKGASS